MRGAALCLLSAAAFGTLGIFGRLASDAGADTATTLLVRFGLAALVFAAVLAWTGGWRALRGLSRRVVLTGLALGAGEHGLGYICDGLIATAAAAVAATLEPDLKPRLLAGHRSPEPAHARLLELLDLAPVLDLQMRLGEASGAVAALAILRLAAATHDQMLTFAEAGVSG